MKPKLAPYRLRIVTTAENPVNDNAGSCASAGAGSFPHSCLWIQTDSERVLFSTLGTGKEQRIGGTGARPKDFCVSLMWSVLALCIGISSRVLMTAHYSDPLAHGFVSVPRTVGPVKRCHRLNGRCPASKPGACEQTVSQPEWTGLSSGNLRAAQGSCDESAVHVILGIVQPEADLNYNLR